MLTVWWGFGITVTLYSILFLYQTKLARGGLKSFADAPTEQECIAARTMVLNAIWPAPQGELRLAFEEWANTGLDPKGVIPKGYIEKAVQVAEFKRKQRHDAVEANKRRR